MLVVSNCYVYLFCVWGFSIFKNDKNYVERYFFFCCCLVIRWYIRWLKFELNFCILFGDILYWLCGCVGFNDFKFFLIFVVIVFFLFVLDYLFEMCEFNLN